MLVVYPAIFHQEDGAYWVEFPDLPGCQSDGETLEDVMENAHEALGLYIYSQYERDIAVPAASDIKTLEVPEDGFVSLVSANPEQFERRTKAIKKTLTIPEWLNIEAEKRHINFSSVLKSALLDKIKSS